MSFELESEAEPLTAEEEAELRSIALEDAEADLADLDLAPTGQDRFNALPSATRAAVQLGKDDVGARLATELLALVPSYEKSWNYGNAIHDAHIALGLIALRKGDVRQASLHLLAAGATPGSPQLDSFGPSMELALALMRAGHFESIGEYLSLCEKFWAMGADWIGVWRDKIARGIVPNCVMHAYR